MEPCSQAQVINERCEQIREALKKASSDYEKEKLQQRLARLSGGVAVLKALLFTSPIITSRLVELVK